MTYLKVASGLPRTNGDKHATAICSMALNLMAACGMIVRPDKKPQTIEIKAGIHTGTFLYGHMCECEPFPRLLQAVKAVLVLCDDGSRSITRSCDHCRWEKFSSPSSRSSPRAKSRIEKKRTNGSSSGWNRLFFPSTFISHFPVRSISLSLSL